MKIVGLITEYNPFHNGHKLHLDTAREITQADYVIVVMSGNYVQRGTPAIVDKYTRTRMALEMGADLVIELPVCYATASAEAFAYGAVSILDKLGIVDSIFFGSECGDIVVLDTLASILYNEPEDFKQHLTESLKMGLTYPVARSQALLASLPLHAREQYKDILSSPNNILGIEYIKALKRLNSPICPVTMTRVATGYHDTSLDSVISSATAIRTAFQNGQGVSFIEHNVPNACYTELENGYQNTLPMFEDDFSQLLHYQLLMNTKDSLALYQDVSEEFANRLLNVATPYSEFTKLALSVKTKEITHTRVNRSLLHIMLQMTKEDFHTFLNNGVTPYARLLGLKKDASFLIRMIKNIDQILVITKLANARKELDNLALSMLRQDIRSSDLYAQMVFQKFGTILPNEYTHGVILK